MSIMARDDLLHQALTLPLEDRLFIAAALENSLPEIPESDADGMALAAELQRRSLAYRSGVTEARDAFEAIDELRQQHAKKYGL